MKIVYTESIHWNLHRTCNTAEAYDGLADSNFFGLVDSNKVGVTSFQLTQAVVGESLSTGPVYSFDIHETHETFVIFRDGTYGKISMSCNCTQLFSEFNHEIAENLEI